ncbi:suppressor protein of silencing [Yersinia phage vB_YenP_Rambo]|uniref:Suppressor protein of silencing n=1 Tax=Yersinia phage vB_YenP_Rambo TaxID=2880894 RepID=A0AC61TNU3_9CAUD|nr:suppressor protein of silencing [Yersinia phage vB_YenP_Rambo]
MAITKRFKVTFEVTAVVDSEDEAFLKDHIIELARQASSGEPLGDYEKEVLVRALTDGHEGLVEFIIKTGLREFIKDAHSEVLSASDRQMLSFAPAKVEVLR